MTLDRSHGEHMMASAIMDQGMITEAKFEGLHCRNEGTALPEMPACPSGDLNKALLYAAAWEGVEKGELLLDCGAQVNSATANGLTPLLVVSGPDNNPRSTLGLEDWLKLLSASGADLNR